MLVAFRAQFQALNLRKEMSDAANIYLFGIIHTKCKYIYRSFVYLFYHMNEDCWEKDPASYTQNQP